LASFCSDSCRRLFCCRTKSASILATCLRSSISATKRPLYSASSKQASSTVVERRSAVSRSVILSRRETSCTSGGRLAIFSLTTASLDAEFSSSMRTLASSSASGGSRGDNVR
uniref:Uncharacterized protein n=1 Tax=Ciona intestinalis TaxID=7719 RepID=H2XTM1_CIOIN